MVDKKKLTRRSALGLVAAGGTLVVVDTLGYDVLEADRLTSILTASDDAALIALVEASYDTVPNNSFETVAHLTNNISDDVNVIYYHLSTNQDGVSIRFDGQESDVGGTVSGSINLAEGGAEPIDLECSQPGQIDGPEILTVQITEVEAENTGMTISDLEFDLSFVCTGGPILEISDIRGLGDHRSFQHIAAEIDISETNNEETSNLEVGLEIVGENEGSVVDEEKQAPADFDEIENQTITVDFDVGQLDEDEYTYTVTANADNATRKSASDTFVVDDELLIIDLAGERTTGARNLGVDALNRSGEPVTLVAVAAEHDPDNDVPNRDRDEFEELSIDIGGTNVVFEDGNGDPLPGDGTRIEHNSVPLNDGQDAEYLFADWSDGGNIDGETFEITIWAEDDDGTEVATTDRVTV